jgi:methionyl-tRNA formyltransferase
MKKKIAVIGSRDLVCEITKWIIETQDVEIVGGMHPPFNGWWDDNFKTVLDDNQIPVFNDLKELLKEKPDVVFSINYWKKIDAEDINSVPEGIVNIHHSYLLKFKGRYSTSWAIIHARKDNCWEHGTTLHYIDERLDEGNIIDSWKCRIEEDDTAEILFSKVEILALELFKANFSMILLGVTDFKEPASTSYFYDKDSNKNLEVSQLMPVEEVYDFVRAWSFKDRPKPYLDFKGNRIYLSLEG